MSLLCQCNESIEGSFFCILELKQGIFNDDAEYLNRSVHNRVRWSEVIDVYNLL